MKKLILLFSLVFLIIPISFIFATSGACSYHRGVNCLAGPSYTGKVQCYDGWINSSVYFSDADECKATTCTTQSDLDKIRASNVNKGLAGSDFASSNVAKCEAEIKNFEAGKNSQPYNHDIYSIPKCYAPSRGSGCSTQEDLESLENRIRGMNVSSGFLPMDDAQRADIAKCEDQIKSYSEAYEKYKQCGLDAYSFNFDTGKFVESEKVSPKPKQKSLDEICQEKYNDPNSHAEGNNCVCNIGYVLYSNYGVCELKKIVVIPVTKEKIDTATQMSVNEWVEAGKPKATEATKKLIIEKKANNSISETKSSLGAKLREEMPSKSEVMPETPLPPSISDTPDNQIPQTTFWQKLKISLSKLKFW